MCTWAPSRVPEVLSGTTSCWGWPMLRTGTRTAWRCKLCESESFRAYLGRFLFMSEVHQSFTKVVETTAKLPLWRQETCPGFAQLWPSRCSGENIMRRQQDGISVKQTGEQLNSTFINQSFDIYKWTHWLKIGTRHRIEKLFDLRWDSAEISLIPRILNKDIKEYFYNLS